MPRDSGKNALKIFFNFTDEQAEALLGNAGTGAVVKPDKKKAPAVASTDAEAAALVKALNVLKVNVEKSLNLN
jgi:ribonuclease HI